MRAKDIIHFDLKPKNILLCSVNDVWKVANFDDAELVKDGEEEKVSGRQSVIVTSKTDVYSAGAILYIYPSHWKDIRRELCCWVLVTWKIDSFEALYEKTDGAMAYFIQEWLEKN